MAFSGVYKLDEGKPYVSNCFPAKSLLRIPEEGLGHWLVTRKGNLKKKPKGMVEAPTEGQECPKKVSFDGVGKKRIQRESQGDVPEHLLDRAFLLKHHHVRKPSDLCSINVSGLKLSQVKEKDFKHFTSVIYINASENLLPLEAFHSFPALKELELAFNGIKRVYVKYGDFKLLEFLDLSFNSLTSEAICDLGILPRLRVLLLTGNGLTSLPPNLAVTEQLKKLSLDQNRIFRIPYLQQVQLRDGSGDWVGSHISPQKESQFTLQPKSWIYEPSDEHPDYTILPMKKDVDRTEVVFSSYPGFSTSETTKVCSLPPIFEILPVKSLKARNQTLAPPFPELRYLSLAYNKIAREDAILPVALFPSLCELIFHNNPLVAHTRGVPPLLKSFLQERLGIHLIRKKVVKAKHHILMPRKETRKVKTQIPKVPKQPLVPRHQPLTTIKSLSRDTPEAELPEELHPASSTSLKAQIAMEGLEGPNLPCRTFVPLPPICSDSTLHSDDTRSHVSNAASHPSPSHLSEEDTKSTESIFLTQVSELPSHMTHRGDLQVKEKDQRRPATAPREVKRTRRKLPSTSIPSKYHGYEDLLTAQPDSAFIEPKGIQKNAQALQHMLKHPLLCHPSKPKLDTIQKHYVPKEKRAQRIPIPAQRKTGAQMLDDILIRMRDPRNVTEAPLGAVLRRRADQRLVNQKQYLEAKRLLKEYRARYRQLVRGSLRKVFRATPPPQEPPALQESQPKFGRFLEFMDEFCQESTASDLKG
ncbi:X-ray radiation resistance-associated protein 1 isoform X3 [Marmota marmota marmota]|uniref:X-ray radiation resistance-associated protein 1 isoform X3 n=1 Tax=Marmota marmota marmota TaxID=9994 RepID=UPI0020930BC7|nr:X-ray radiation resistance-associated protein 1 isoform X3 [Marmota marmota marmota]